MSFEALKNRLKRSRKFQPEDRLFSLSSVTSPAAEEQAAGRDDGRSDYGVGRPRGGGIYEASQRGEEVDQGTLRESGLRLIRILNMTMTLTWQCELILLVELCIINLHCIFLIFLVNIYSFFRSLSNEN
ncbi:uncharacterized protein LOC126654427 isoform X3 [Mercurialis annua]|uniref:uncharacterized protein LOC126654427 isoform X3 n=1 Tax=Mercurialis annua TaxID=3986 RepID=UPI00215EE9F7|nr:uncharacterized protein LOC126654427 isoform X3 [Mercurialis annua]